MFTYKNKSFIKRNYDYTNIVFCQTDKPMTKKQVIKVLSWALTKGYEHTAQIKITKQID